jgi:hypothetical protein
MAVFGIGNKSDACLKSLIATCDVCCHNHALRRLAFHYRVYADRSWRIREKYMRARRVSAFQLGPRVLRMPAWNLNGLAYSEWGMNDCCQGICFPRRICWIMSYLTNGTRNFIDDLSRQPGAYSLTHHHCE